MDQARDAVSSCEAGADALPVLPDAAGDVVGDANVKRPVLAAGKDVNIVGHRHAPTPMGPGDTPRDDNDMYNPCEIDRSEAHTYALQSLMCISYAVFCLYQIIQHLSPVHTHYHHLRH